MELKRTDNNVPYVCETETEIIANSNGSRKQLLFANNVKSIFAFAIYKDDIFCHKDGDSFLFCRVVNVNDDNVDLILIESINNIENMPFEFQEIALALIEKSRHPQKCCYYLSKTRNETVDKMVRTLRSFNHSTTKVKKEIIHQLLADLSALEV